MQSLCERLGLAKASRFRLMHTLEEAGYVGKDASGRLFRRRPRVAAVRPVPPPTARCGELRDASPAPRFRETVSLAALFDNHVEVVEVFESPEFMRMSNTVRAHPACRMPARWARPSPRFRPRSGARCWCAVTESIAIPAKTIVDESDLQQEFEEIRRRGHAADAEENTPGGRCHGVPLLDGSGTAFAALSVSCRPAATRPRARSSVSSKRSRKSAGKYRSRVRLDISKRSVEGGVRRALSKNETFVLK